MLGKGSIIRRAGRVACAAGLLTLAACSAQFRNHGYVPEERELAELVPGIDTRATVESSVGVPGVTGLSDGAGYYYVASRMRHFAWQEPEIVDREVVAITFAADDTVAGIERYGLEHGRVVPLSRRVTRSGGGDISFIRKLFGNIGRLDTTELLRSQ
ncbi:outer membrane protein assembly factor BamE [Roseivivax sp. CAU 1761]